MYVNELTKSKYRGKQPRAIHVSEDVVAMNGRRLRREEGGHFLVLLFNARHESTDSVTVSVMSLNASIVHSREVFKPAVVQSAAYVVLVHNDPPGDPESSEQVS